MIQEPSINRNINVEDSRNWPGLAAAAALFIVGWMLVNAYGDLPRLAVVTATEIRTPVTGSPVLPPDAKAGAEADWVSAKP